MGRIPRAFLTKVGILIQLFILLHFISIKAFGDCPKNSHSKSACTKLVRVIETIEIIFASLKSWRVLRSQNKFYTNQIAFSRNFWGWDTFCSIFFQILAQTLQLCSKIKLISQFFRQSMLDIIAMIILESQQSFIHGMLLHRILFKNSRFATFKDSW